MDIQSWRNLGLPRTRTAVRFTFRLACSLGRRRAGLRQTRRRLQSALAARPKLARSGRAQWKIPALQVGLRTAHPRFFHRAAPLKCATVRRLPGEASRSNGAARWTTACESGRILSRPRRARPPDWAIEPAKPRLAAEFAPLRDRLDRA